MKLRMKILLPIIIVSIISTSIMIFISTKKQNELILDMLDAQIHAQINTAASAGNSFDSLFNQIIGKYNPSKGEIEEMVKVTNYQKMAEEIEVGKDGYGIVIDMNGVIWVHKNQQLLGSNIVDLASWGKEIMKNDEGEFKMNFEDKEYKVIYKKIASINKLICLYSPDEFKKDINTIKYIEVVILSIAIIIIILLVAYIIQLRIIKPIKILVENMQKVGKGQLNTKIKLKSKDEIAMLGEQFNLMVSDMRNMTIKIKDTARIIKNSSSMISNSTNEATESSKQLKIAIHEIAMGIEHLADETNKTFKATTQLANSIDNIKEQVYTLPNKRNNTLNNNNFYTQNNMRNDIGNRIDEICIEIQDITEKKDITLEAVKNITAVTEQSSAATQEIFATIEEQTESIEKISLAIAELNYLVTLLSSMTEKIEY